MPIHFTDKYWIFVKVVVNDNGPTPIRIESFYLFIRRGSPSARVMFETVFAFLLIKNKNICSRSGGNRRSGGHVKQVYIFLYCRSLSDLVATSLVGLNGEFWARTGMSSNALYLSLIIASIIYHFMRDHASAPLN